MHNDLKIRLSKFNINYLLIIACAGFSLTPYLSRNLPRLIQVAILVAWVVSYITILLRYKTKKDHLTLVAIIIFWQVWEFFLRVAGYSTAAWGNYFVSAVFYCTICMMLFINEFFNTKQKRSMAFVLYFIIFLNIISNLHLYVLYPQAHSLINSPWGTIYSTMNVGETPFYTVTLIYYGICLMMVLNGHGKGLRLVSILGMVLSVFFMVQVAPRAIELMLLSLMTILILIEQFSKGHKKLFYSIAFFALIIIGLFAVPILNYLIDIIESPRLMSRFQDMVFFLQGNSSFAYGDGSFATRVFLIQTSIKTFISTIVTFFVGVGNHIATDALSTNISQHSGFIDILAKYGIVGALFVVNIFASAYKKIKALTCLTSYGNQIIIIFIVFIVNGFLNESFKMEMGFAVFVLLPLTPYLIEKNKQKNVSQQNQSYFNL